MTVGTVCIVSAQLNGYHHFRLRVDCTSLGYTATTYPDISWRNISQAVSYGEFLAQKRGFYFILSKEDILTMNQNYAFTPAQDDVNLLRMAIAGPSGGGKTWTALAIASAMGARIGLIDTENKTASKYKNYFKFDKLDLVDHSPTSYINALQVAQQCQFDVLIIDSLSHAWMGRGGALEMVDNASARNRNNSWAAWREVTPQHNALVDALIYLNMHLIVTMRARTEWILEEDPKTKKKTPVKVGLEPVFRKGIEFEFDVFADMDESHRMIITKSRCPELDQAVFLKPKGEELSGTIKAWLASTQSNEPTQITAPTFGPVDVTPVNPVDRAGNVPDTGDINFDDDDDRHPDAGKHQVLLDLLEAIHEIGDNLYQEQWGERASEIASNLFKEPIEDVDENSLDVQQAQQLLQRMKSIEEMFTQRDNLITRINQIGEELYANEWDDQLTNFVFSISEEQTTSIYRMSLPQLRTFQETLLELQANAPTALAAPTAPTVIVNKVAATPATATPAAAPAEPEPDADAHSEFYNHDAIIAEMQENGIALHGEAWTAVLEDMVRKASNQTTTDIHLLTPQQLKVIHSILTHDFKQQQQDTADQGPSTTIAEPVESPASTIATPVAEIPTALALDALGEQIYGTEEWPRQRRNAVRKFTDQRTASLKKMNDNERTALHTALLHVQANQ